MPLFGDGEPTQEELVAMHEEQERRRTERQTANDLARSAAQQEGTNKPGYWDVIRSPDIESGIESYDEHIDALLATELSGQLSTGYITRGDYDSLQWRIEYEMWLVKNEFQDPDSNLDDLDMLAMGYEDKPTLTDRRARRLRSAELVRKQMASNSVDARGLRSGTEIHAVSRTEDGSRRGEDGEGSGMFGRARRYLSA